MDKRTFNPCDECRYGIDRRDGSGSDAMCKICEFKVLLEKPERSPKPEALTFEELEGFVDEPVWIVDLEIPSCSEWRIIREYWTDGSGGEVDFEGGYEALPEDDYGKTWLAYATKPETEGD